MPIAIVVLTTLALQQGSADLVGPAPTAWTPLEYYRTHREADALYARRDWSRAVPLYERLVEHSPADGETWHHMGVGQYHLRNYPEAIAAFEGALEVGYGDSSSLQYNLACCHALAKQSDPAFEWIEAALSSRLDSRASLQRDSDLAELREDPRWKEATGAPPEEERTRDEGWRLDLDFLVAEARRLHADPERPAFSRHFADNAASLQEAIPGLTNDQILARMMRLIAILDDGHSVLYGPGGDTPLEFEGHTLPFKFYWFPEGLTIVDGADDWGEHAGSRVLRFGALSAEEVLLRMSAYRGVDNAMTWVWMGPQFYLRQLALLREVGATSTDSSVELTLLTPDGQEQTITVPGGDFELIRKLRPSPAAVGEVPRYLRSVDTSYWMEPLPEHGALYFQFNQVRNAPMLSIAAFAERLREALAEDDVRTLIVDVRHNNGGNNTLVRPLVRALIEFEARAARNRIFVIMGRNTFSAAQNFINRVERWTDAEFVGEPSSSSPNFVGEETDVVLPCSRIRGSVSTRYWQDSDPWDERAWIAPDVPVTLTAAEYFENHDPALDAILQVASGG